MAKKKKNSIKYGKNHRIKHCQKHYAEESGISRSNIIIKVHVNLNKNTDQTPKIEIYTFIIQAPVDDILIAKDGAVNSYKSQDASVINTGDNSTQSYGSSVIKDKDRYNTPTDYY